MAVASLLRWRGVEVEQQLLPGLHALAHAVGQADEFLLAFRRRADDHEKALGVILEASLHVNAIRPEIDIAFGGEIALRPTGMLLGPGVLKPRDRCGGQPTRVAAKQSLE